MFQWILGLTPGYLWVNVSMSTWDHTRLFVGSCFNEYLGSHPVICGFMFQWVSGLTHVICGFMLFIPFLRCAMYIILFVFVLCLVYSMLPVFLWSIFSNVYFRLVSCAYFVCISGLYILDCIFSFLWSLFSSSVLYPMFPVSIRDSSFFL